MHDDETIRGRFIALRLVSSPPFPPLEIRIKGKPLAFNLASFHTTRYNYPALAGAARSLQQRFKSARNRFLISQRAVLFVNQTDSFARCSRSLPVKYYPPPPFYQRGGIGGKEGGIRLIPTKLFFRKVTLPKSSPQRVRRPVSCSQSVISVVATLYAAPRLLIFRCVPLKQPLFQRPIHPEDPRGRFLCSISKHRLLLPCPFFSFFFLPSLLPPPTRPSSSCGTRRRGGVRSSIDHDPFETRLMRRGRRYFRRKVR